MGGKLQGYGYLRSGIRLLCAHRSIRTALTCLFKGSVSLGVGTSIQNSKLTGVVTVGQGCRLYGVTISGKVCVGRYTSISGPGSTVFSRVTSVTIGNFCSIARNVQIQEYNHDLRRPSTYFIRSNVLGLRDVDEVISKGPVEIGHDVWIGANSVVLSGVKIGNGAVIAAGSVVSADVPAYSVVGGVPARVIRMRFSEEQISRLQALNWYEWPVDKIRENRDFFSTVMD